jgi:hypothetical protein
MDSYSNTDYENQKKNENIYKMLPNKLTSHQ